jgi:mannosyltransferase
MPAQTPTSIDPSIPISREPRFEISPVVVLIALLLIVIVGVVLRLHLLERRDLWDDEAASVIFAQLSWSGFVSTLRNYEANMAFYYLLLHYWLHFGDNVTFIRGLSVLFGVAAIPATYMLGKTLFGVKEGIVSAAFSAVNTFQIRYSQEARSYSLVILLSILSTFFLVRAIETPRQRRFWVSYVLMSALGIYAHVFFILVVAAQWLSVGYGLIRRQRQAAFWTVTGLLLLSAPMGIFLLTKNQGQLNWVLRPTPQELLEFFKLFTGYGGSALLSTYCFLCLIAVFHAYREPRGSAALFDERQRTGLVASWLVFPIAFVVSTSFVEAIFYDRYMAISAPALALLAGKGVIDLDRLFPRFRALVPGMLLLFFLLSFWGILRYNRGPAAQGDQWQSVTRYVLAGQQTGDSAFFYRASGSRPFTYYAHREIETHGAASSPEIVFPYDVSNAQDFNVEPKKEQAKLALGGSRRIWLILQHYRELQERRAAKQNIQDALSTGYHISQEKDFPGGTGAIEVLLYVQDTPSNAKAQMKTTPPIAE